MAVREFDGSGDNLITDVGALSGMTYGTFAIIFKRGATGATQTLSALHTSSTGSGGLVFINNDLSIVLNGSENESFLTLTNTDDWFLFVARKDTGVELARGSLYNFTTDSWDHGDASDTLGDWDAPSVGGDVRFNYQGSVPWDGRIAVRAMWSNSLPWSADASGDSAIEAAGLEEWAKNWIDNSPDAMWRFNQASTSTAVTDDTENGADETSLSGTTVVTGDDPPGFDFSIASDVADADGEAATIAATANNAAASVGATTEPATVSTVAGNATVTVTGEPDGIAATVSVTANDATVDAVGDSVEANAIAATVSVTASNADQDVGVHAVTATVATAAQGATPTSQSQVNAGRATVNVNALNATVTVNDESVTVNAQVATVGVTANGVAPTGEANATATAATISVTANSPAKQATAQVATVDVDARGASVAVDAGEIAQGDAAEVSVTALSATVTVSDNITARPREARVTVTANNAGVTIDQPPLPMYTFLPPTVIEHFEHLQDKVFQRKFTWQKGVSVVRKGGTFVNTRFVVPDPGGPDDLLIEGEDFFLGGFHYVIPEPIALELIAAGYEPELIE